MTITYQVQVDTQRNNTFGASIDDISAYVISMNWRNGMSSAYEEVAPPARAMIMLDNSGREFNTEATGSQLLANNAFATWSSDNPSSWTVTGESGSNPAVSQTGANVGQGGGGTGAANFYTTGTAVSISQSILTSGSSYRVTLSLSFVDSAQPGGIAIYNNTTRISPIYHVAGYYTFNFNATHTSFRIETTGACNCTIDEITVYAIPVYAVISNGMLLRIRYDTGGGYSQYFIGRITSIAPVVDPQSGQIQGQSVTLTVEDPMLELLDLEYAPELLEDVRVDEVLTNIFQDAITPWPYASSGWLLGIQGASELGQTTILHNTAFTSFDTGQTSFTYVGDAADRGSGVSAQGYIRDLLAAEGGGRFFWDGRAGAFAFHSRHRDPLNTVNSGTYTDASFVTVQPVFGTDLVNDITINYQARSVGDPETVIWTLKNTPMRLSGNSKRTITAQYTAVGDDKLRIGAKDYVPPVRGIDLIADTQENGEGQDATSQIEINIEWGATSAKVTYTNTNGGDIYIISAQLRATPLTARDETYTAQNGDSIRKYARRPAPPMDIRLLNDRNFVEQLGIHTVNKLGEPFTRFESVSFIVKSATQETMATARTIGNVIAVTESWTGHSRSYVLVGEEHTYAAGAANTHTVRWILKPLDTVKYWILGVVGRSELDRTTLLAL